MAQILLTPIEPDHRSAADPMLHPVDVGVLVPQGALSATAFANGFGRVSTQDGSEVDSVVSARSWWDEARTSIKWLLVQLVADTTVVYVFDTEALRSPPSAGPLASTIGDRIVVDTGPMRATIPLDGSALLSQVDADGQELVTSPVVPMHLVATTVTDSWYRECADGANPGTGPIATRYTAVSLDLVENTWLRSEVAGRGLLVQADSPDETWCQVDWRLVFYRGERFCRLLHTVTWRRRRWEDGAIEMSIALAVLPAASSEQRIGIEGEQPHDLSSSSTYGVQRDNDSGPEMEIGCDTTLVREGPGRLSGWLEASGTQGRRLRICLKHLWQQYPKGFRVDPVPDTTLTVDLWPRRGADPMSFRPEDIMSRQFFEETGISIAGEDCPFHEAQAQTRFEHTGEGVSRTHELLFEFTAEADGDEVSGRTVEELHDLLTYPVVLRQDPTTVMASDVLGFRFSPVADPNSWAERQLVSAADQMFLRRHRHWDYGFWRFGMLHFNQPGSDRGTYRIFDGTQYGLQLVPWLLFVRGGPRRFFDEAAVSTRYAMDVATNHYTTRTHTVTDPESGDQITLPLPPGFAADARSTPFPWQAWELTHSDKKAKLHYLLWCYHLTGYERARETIELQVNGAVTQLDDLLYPGSDLVDQLTSRGHSPRELTGPVLFWAQAAGEITEPIHWSTDYESTVRPQLRRIAEAWWRSMLIQTSFSVDRAHGAMVNVFDGFGAQLDLDHPAELEKLAWQVISDALTGTGFADSDTNDLYNIEYCLAALLALQRQAPGYGVAHAQTLWDLAQGLADVIAAEPPIADGNAPITATHRGTVTLRQLVYPLLAGLAAAHDHHLIAGPPSPNQHPRALLALGNEEEDNNRAIVHRVFVRSVNPGPLSVDVSVTHADGWNGPRRPVEITASTCRNGQWSPVATARVPGHTPHQLGDAVPTYRGQLDSARLVFRGAQPGDIYRIELLGRPINRNADNRADESPKRLRVGVDAGDAQIVHRISTGLTSTLGIIAPSPNSAPAWLYLQPTADEVSIYHIQGMPFSIRVAHTWDRLDTVTVGQPPPPGLPARTVHLTVPTPGPNRPLLALVTPGEWIRLDGVLGFVATAEHRWFVPPP